MCGDFINDYEGIAGYEAYRGDLTLMYFLQFDLQTHTLVHFEMMPMQIRRFQLHYASEPDCQWLLSTLAKVSASFNTLLVRGEQGKIVVRV